MYKSLTESSPDILLDVNNVSIRYPLPEGGYVHAVEGLSFVIRKGETLAIVGESGCGKSVTAFSIMGLLQPPGEITSGRIYFEMSDILTMPPLELRELRGEKISMIFQEPMTSLNPVLKIGFQINEVLRLHRKMDRHAADNESIRMLDLVGIPNARDVFHAYPHQLSGGMRQRVMIAMALSCRPKLLIADEPTTALDVTIQAEILSLIDRLKAEIGMSLLLITHNLGIVAERAHRTLVMYAGRAVESGPTSAILHTPLHPYTKSLLDSLPQNSSPGKRLPTIHGGLPSNKQYLGQCNFSDRCLSRHDECINQPAMVEVNPGHFVSCWRFK